MSENESTVNQLKKAWELERIQLIDAEKEEDKIYSYIAKSDLESMKSNQHLFYYYQTHILPQPFFGNIVNPEIVILALNPKYLPSESEDEYKKLLKKFENESLDEYIKNINKIFELGLNEKNDDYCTKKWWKSVFAGLFDGDIKDIIKDEGKIGIFNLCGYHSVGYNKVHKDAFENGKCELATQRLLIEYLKEIISKAEYVIRIWGKQEWDPIFENELKLDNDKVIIVNSRNKFNKNIKNAIDDEKIKKLKNIIKKS